MGKILVGSGSLDDGGAEQQQVAVLIEHRELEVWHPIRGRRHIPLPQDTPAEQKDTRGVGFYP